MSSRFTDVAPASTHASCMVEHLSEMGPISERSTGDVAIRAENLSKFYRIYDKPSDRLKQSLYPRLQRLFGQPPGQYGHEFWALNDVTFEVKRGETIGIIGRNGAGKSTLLQLICGTLAPNGGTVTTHGRIAALLELGSGFNAEFTGRENVYMNAFILGLTKKEIEAKYNDIVAFADIGLFIDQPVKTYSSGMHVRLAFAVIAHMDADILIIDEALAVGDAFFTQKCMRFLRNFQKTGTILFVSHDSGAVVNLCSRAIWFEHGGIRMQGEAKALCERYLASQYERVGSLIRPDPKPASASLMAAGVNVSSEIEPQDSTDTRCECDQPPMQSSYTGINAIEVFAFNPDAAGFGTGGASITAADLIDSQGIRLNWIAGGEMVSVRVSIQANGAIDSLIIGFFVKDRLGQTLFGDNTYQTFHERPVGLHLGEAATAIFTFRMPILPQGTYTADVAVADGTHQEHVQLQWLLDAIVFVSHTSSLATGLVGVPLGRIELFKSSCPTDCHLPKNVYE